MENIRKRVQEYDDRSAQLQNAWEKYQHQKAETEQQNPDDVVAHALGGEDSPLNESAKANLVHKVLYAPKNEIVHDGRQNKPLAEIAEDLSVSIEKDTFYFNQASSIENIHCETTSMNEYFTWIQEGKDIIKHMNDGRVTYQDVAERDDFLTMSFQRETELLTCLGLYDRSIALGNETAKERRDELCLKLQRLREIRSAIQETCMHEVDKEITPKDHAKAVAHYKALGLMDSAGLMLSGAALAEYESQAEDLEISHKNDDEFLLGYSFYTRLLEKMRLSRRQGRGNKTRSLERRTSQHRSPGEFLYLARHQEAKEADVISRIEHLRGLRALSQNARD